MAELVMDLAFDEGTLEEAVRSVERQFGVNVTVLREVGPGGGWPEVRLTGTKEQLARAAREGWGWDDSDLRELEPGLL